MTNSDRALLRWSFTLLGCLLHLQAGQFDQTAESIRRQLVDSGAPSLAVAVAKDGKIIWEQGFGWADRARRIPADEHTLYSLASISKPFTATDRKSTRLNSSHLVISYAVFCLKKKKNINT